jgi:hypothetical protein
MIVGDIRNQRAIVNDIEKELAIHEKDEKALKLLVQQLSPTECIESTDKDFDKSIKTFSNQTISGG